MLEALRRFGGGRRARGLESVRIEQDVRDPGALAYSAVEKALASPIKIEGVSEVRQPAPATAPTATKSSVPVAAAPKPEPEIAPPAPKPVEKGRTIPVPDSSSSSPEYHAELADSMLKLLEEREARTESSIRKLDAEYDAERERRAEEYHESRERLTKELEGIRRSEKFYRAAPELLLEPKERPTDLPTEVEEAPPVAPKRTPRKRSRARKTETGEAAS